VFLTYSKHSCKISGYWWARAQLGNKNSFKLAFWRRKH